MQLGGIGLHQADFLRVAQSAKRLHINKRIESDLRDPNQALWRLWNGG